MLSRGSLPDQDLTPGTAPVDDPALVTAVRAAAREAAGPRARIRRLDALRGDGGGAVVLVTLDPGDRRVVVKLTLPRTGAGPTVGTTGDPERTARAMASARAAGVPTAEVLAARSPRRPDDRGHLVLRHVPGVEWRHLRPALDDDEVRSVHRQLAEALLALRTVTVRRFGDLDGGDGGDGRDGGDGGEGGGADLRAALRRRADRLVADEAQRARFSALLDREAGLLRDDRPTLCHDDLHHGNVLLSREEGRWRVAALLDWDKAWAGPAESDVARMAFWDDMTGPGFWEVYRAAVPEGDGWGDRAAIHQLLWCLEHAAPTDRHRADTAALWAALDRN